MVRRKIRKRRNLPMRQMTGKQSIKIAFAVYFECSAAIVGEMDMDGPLG